MEITAILNEIKGKVLDATHFELLKHAYDLQNQNIHQLKKIMKRCVKVTNYLNLN